MSVWPPSPTLIVILPVAGRRANLTGLNLREFIFDARESDESRKTMSWGEICHFVSCRNRRQKPSPILVNDIKDGKKHGSRVESDVCEGKSRVLRSYRTRKREGSRAVFFFFFYFNRMHISGDALYIECERSRPFSFLPTFLRGTFLSPLVQKETRTCVDRSRTVRVACHWARGRVTTRTRQCCIAAMISLISRSAAIQSFQANTRR